LTSAWSMNESKTWY